MKKFQIKKDDNTFSRFEFKYVIKKKISESIKHEVKHFMKQDNFTEINDFYLVRSLYFDNSFFSHFHEKIDGIKNRHKFRIRTYAKSEENNVPIYLEVKGRNNLRTFKNRTKVNSSDHSLFYKKKNLLDLKKKYFKNELVHNFIYDVYRKNISPKVLIDYKRLPLVSKNGLYFRLTFDSELRACVAENIFENKRNWKLCIPGYDILEVKFDFTIPPWFHRIIQNYQLKRLSVSKFVLGLEATNLAHDYEGI